MVQLVGGYNFALLHFGLQLLPLLLQLPLFLCVRLQLSCLDLDFGSLKTLLQNVQVLLVVSQLLLTFEQLGMDWVLKRNCESAVPSRVQATGFPLLLLQFFEVLLFRVSLLHFLLV